MMKEAYRAPDNHFHWLDVCDPTGMELEQIAEKYNLHPTSVRDCLTPKHLPKVEMIGENIFIILRSYHERARNRGTIRGLTTKIAIFIGKDYIVTIHRKEQAYISQIRDSWVKDPENLENDLLARLLIRIIYGVFSTYTEATYLLERKLESFENRIFREGSNRRSIQEKFLVKRKANVFKHILKMSLDALPKLKNLTVNSTPWFQEMQELGEAQYFASVELLDNVNNLINLQLSLSSQQTSEVVKVLTLFSVFFMPMTFLAGVYGMNFKHMPELDYKYSYPIVLCVMATIASILFTVFKRKKWL
jgi:magnesium transporter